LPGLSGLALLLTVTVDGDPFFIMSSNNTSSSSTLLPIPPPPAWLYTFLALILITTLLLAYVSVDYLLPSLPPSKSIASDPMTPSPPASRKKTRMYWFTMISLVGPVYLITPFCWLVVAWGLAASFGLRPWPAERGSARIWAGAGMGWAVLEVSASLFG
jgi:hypothetical protein